MNRQRNGGYSSEVEQEMAIQVCPHGGQPHQPQPNGDCVRVLPSSPSMTASDFGGEGPPVSYSSHQQRRRAALMADSPEPPPPGSSRRRVRSRSREDRMSGSSASVDRVEMYIDSRSPEEGDFSICTRCCLRTCAKLDQSVKALKRR